MCAPIGFGSVAVFGWPEACDSRLRVCGAGSGLSWYIVMVFYGQFGDYLRMRAARPRCRGVGGGWWFSAVSGIAHSHGDAERHTHTHNFSIHIICIDCTLPLFGGL